MALPDRLNIHREAWSSVTAASTDTGVQYALGNVVTHQGHTWMYAITTAGDTSEPSSSNSSWIQIDGTGGVAPTPQEHFNLTVSPTSIVEDSTVTTPRTITVTLGVTGGFTYTGYTNARVTGPNGDLAVSAVSGTSTIFTFNVLPAAPAVFQVSASIRSTDSTGAVVPNHAIGGTFRITAPIPDWYAVDNVSTAPTSITGLTSQGDWTGSGSYTATKTAGNNLFIILPEVSGRTYVFRSGTLFLDTTDHGLIASNTYRVFQMNDFNNAATGATLTVNITEA